MPDGVLVVIMNLCNRLIFLFFISASLIFCGCSKNKKVESVEESEDTELKSETGEAVRVIAPAQLENRGKGNARFFVKGESSAFSGQVRDFYENGQKKAVTGYRGGLKHWYATEWDESGKVTSKVLWRNGYIHSVIVKRAEDEGAAVEKK